MEHSAFPTLVDGAPVIRGSVENKAFLAFWQHGHSVLAGMSVNWPRADKPQKAIKALIAARAAVSAESLADPGVPLEKLLLQA